MPSIRCLTIRPIAFALGLGLMLGGCGQTSDEKAAAAAGGEVLPGTISDDMIDLDTSTASPPLAPAQSEKKKKAAPAVSEAAQEAPAAADTPPVAPAAASADTQ